MLLDAGERLGETVDKRLAAYEADVWMGLGLGEQMLAAAEADLQPDFAWAFREQRAGVGDWRRSDLQPRQTLGDQRGMMGAERLAAAAPIEGAPRCFGAGVRQETRPRNLSPRSVFSQEKPPSESGWRPK